jgi:hypothetical protein
MFKGWDLASDPNRIDKRVKRDQADKILHHLSNPVKKLRTELEEIAKEVILKNAKGERLLGLLEVKIYDSGLQNGKVQIEVTRTEPLNKPKVCLNIEVTKEGHTIRPLDRNLNDTTGHERLLKDRNFVKTLEKLIKEIQINEIPNNQ